MRHHIQPASRCIKWRPTKSLFPMLMAMETYIAIHTTENAHGGGNTVAYRADSNCDGGTNVDGSLSLQKSVPQDCCFCLLNNGPLACARTHNDTRCQQHLQDDETGQLLFHGRFTFLFYAHVLPIHDHGSTVGRVGHEKKHAHIRRTTILGSVTGERLATCVHIPTIYQGAHRLNCGCTTSMATVCFG